MPNLVNLTQVLTYLQAEQEFHLSPGQAWVRSGRLAQPFLGALTDRPAVGQIWPRGEYESTDTIGTTQPEPPAFATTVTVTPEEFSIDTAGPTTQQLTARAFDEDGNELFDHAVTWVSSDPSNATVSQTGLVSPVSTGDATISAVIDGAVGTALCHVFTSPPAVASVTVAPDPFAVGIGLTKQLTAVCRAAGGEVLLGRTVTWDSDTPSTATVNGSGLVTGIAEGDFIVVATSEGIDSNDANGTVLPTPDVTDPLYYFSCNEGAVQPLVSSGRGGGGTAPGSSIVLPGEVASAFNMQVFTGHSGNARRNTATNGVYQPTDALARFPGNQSWSVAVWFNRSEGNWGNEAQLMDHNGLSGPVVHPFIWAGSNLVTRAGALTLETDYFSNITLSSLLVGWNHIAATNDVPNNQLRFYLNGVLTRTISAINVSAIGSGEFGFGVFIGNSFNLTKPWGSFDELYIFDRVINAASVAILAA